jgi:hypothetical protein
MDATSEVAFRPLGCLPSVVPGPAVLPLVPGLDQGWLRHQSGPLALARRWPRVAA